jgi:hypothetical protein
MAFGNSISTALTATLCNLSKQASLVMSLHSDGGHAPDDTNTNTGDVDNVPTFNEGSDDDAPDISSTPTTTKASARERRVEREATEQKKAILRVRREWKLVGKSNIKVVVRIRPLVGVEVTQGDHKTLELAHNPSRPASSTTTTSNTAAAAAAAAAPAAKKKRAGSGTIILKDPKEGRALQNGGSDDVLFRSREAVYEFDKVLDDTATQLQVYEASARLAVLQILKGVNATVFAYGATGSGKTYTMMGTQHDPGIISNLFNDLFRRMAYLVQEDPAVTFSLSASFLEIYNEEISDLLQDSPLQAPSNSNSAKQERGLPLREDEDGGAVIVGLTHVPISSVDDVLDVLKAGERRRRVDSHLLNEVSSRSHAILQVLVRQERSSLEQRDGDDDAGGGGGGNGANNNATNGGGRRRSDARTVQVTEVREAKLSLIDLAGSERTKTTGTVTNKKMMREGAQINRSLHALANCINSLVKESLKQNRRRRNPAGGNGGNSNNNNDDGNGNNNSGGKENNDNAVIHVRYRDSKLTRLLKDSLGGDATAIMIAHVSGASSQFCETRETLKYASRTKAIQKYFSSRQRGGRVTETAEERARKEVRARERANERQRKREERREAIALAEKERRRRNTEPPGVLGGGGGGARQRERLRDARLMREARYVHVLKLLPMITCFVTVLRHTYSFVFYPSVTPGWYGKPGTFNHAR